VGGLQHDESVVEREEDINLRNVDACLRYENPSHALEQLSVLGRREQLDARLDLIEEANLADERISRFNIRPAG
jgi:hypothetical protein